MRYEIDPYKKDAFIEYARNWGQAILRCGADLVGYFAPPEGSVSTAYGIYHLPDLTSNEAYRARLAADPLGRAEKLLPAPNQIAILVTIKTTFRWSGYQNR
ncbi:NIPSNAP family protein [Thalassospira lucentensis]|uniref:NIPSNAP family protein n=1 Tax=Thalassospira lucentensis TaxID=168935 RepID=UPI003AA9DB06